MTTSTPIPSATPVGGQPSGPSPQGGGLPLFRKSHKVAILIDGEWFRKELEAHFVPHAARVAARAARAAGTTPPASPIPNGITADILYRNALAAINPNEEECFRVFYYDAEPFSGKVTNPIDGTATDYSASPTAVARKRFFRELGEMELVALRKGDCRGRGWQIKDVVLQQRIRSGHTAISINAGGINYVFEQKGVDMRMGMDVATLSLKRIVDRIIVLSGDTDLIPALKLARREGLQVGVGYVANGKPHAMLVEDSDFIRQINPVLT